jgi:predicted Zn-dependent protease
MPTRCSEGALGWRIAAALPALLLAACGTLTVPQEQQLGAKVAAEMRRDLVFVRDRVVAGYVREMGEEIVRAAGPQPFEYSFYVVQDDDINAFAGPAGYIYIHTETILKARNASELAGVIAHEVAHVARRHVAQNYNRQRNTGIGYQAAVLAASALGGGAAATAAQFGGGLAAMAYLNSFGREAEMEADDFAVDVLPRAGYDPVGLLTFFETLRSETGGGGGGFLSSHPATDERIAATRSRIAELPDLEGLRIDDGGRLEIIQRRIVLITGSQRRSAPPGGAPGPAPL